MAVNRLEHQPPSIFSSSALWAAIGLFGLILGSILLTLENTVFSAVTWLADISHSGPNSLSDKTADQVKDGIHTWGWAGLVTATTSLPIAFESVRARLSHLIQHIMPNAEGDSLPQDRYGRTFFLALAGVFAFTVLAHWSLTVYAGVDWIEGEDGISEWWSVATYLAGAGAAAAAAWHLRSNRNSTPVVYFYLILAAVLFLGAMEEISWGQRIAGWGTPAVLNEINGQGETTIHNVGFADNMLFISFFWASVIGLLGGLVRTTANLRGWSKSLNLVLPSLVMAPPLLLIMVWRAGDFWATANIPRLFMDYFNSGPRGSEVPEVLLGLCIVIYTFANLRQARLFARPAGNTIARLQTASPNLTIPVIAKESA